MTTSKFPPLDPVIHSQVRLAVLSVLIGLKEADFNYLKEVTKTTDGNLSTHLSKLEEAGYVTIKKSFKGKKPVTTCSITEKGKKAFTRYLEALRDYLPRERDLRTKE